MTVVRTSISMSLELDQALLALRISARQSKSKLIETLLRENPTVQRTIESIRLELKINPVVVPGPEGMARFREAVSEAARPYVDEVSGRLRLVAISLCASGRK